MRSDTLKKWLDHKGEKLPTRMSDVEDNDDLTIEDWLVIDVISDCMAKPNGALFNAIMAQRYGQPKAGDGPELTGGDKNMYNASFGTVIDDE